MEECEKVVDAFSKLLIVFTDCMQSEKSSSCPGDELPGQGPIKLAQNFPADSRPTPKTRSANCVNPLSISRNSEQRYRAKAQAVGD